MSLRRAAVASPNQLMSRTLLAAMMRLGDVALLVLLVLAARWLGSQQFGIFMFGLTLASVIVIPVLEAFMPIVAKRAARMPERIGGELGAVLPLQAALWMGVTALVAAGLLLTPTDAAHRRVLVIMLGAVGMRGPMEIMRAAFRGLGRLDIELAMVTIERLGLLACGVLVLRAGGGPVGLGLCFIAARLLAVMAAAGWLVRLGHPIVWRTQGWRAALSEAWPYSVTIGVMTAYGSVGILVLGWLAGDVATGHYGAVYRIFEGLVSIPQVLVLVLLPELAARHGAVPSSVAPLVRRATTYTGLLALPMAAGLWVEGAWVLTSVFGSGYGAAFAPLAVLSAGLLLVFSTEIARTALWAIDRHRTVLVGTSLGLAINVGLAVWLIPSRGVTGAAIAAVVSSAATWLVLWRALGHSGVRWPWMSAVAKPMVVAAAVFLVLRGLQAAPWLVRFAAGGLAALGTMVLAKVVSPLEWQLVGSLPARCMAWLTVRHSAGRVANE